MARVLGAQSNRHDPSSIGQPGYSDLRLFVVDLPASLKLCTLCNVIRRGTRFPEGSELCRYCEETEILPIFYWEDIEVTRYYTRHNGAVQEQVLEFSKKPCGNYHKLDPGPCVLKSPMGYTQMMLKSVRKYHEVCLVSALIVSDPVDLTRLLQKSGSYVG